MNDRKSKNNTSSKSTQQQRSPRQSESVPWKGKLSTWVLDVTFEQHPGSLSLPQAKPGERDMHLQVGWLPLQWSPEKHMMFTMKMKVIITRKGVEFPIAVAEVTTISNFPYGTEEALDGSSADVIDVAKSAWPLARSALQQVLAIGSHHPHLPDDLPLPAEQG